MFLIHFNELVFFSCVSFGLGRVILLLLLFIMHKTLAGDPTKTVHSYRLLVDSVGGKNWKYQLRLTFMIQDGFGVTGRSKNRKHCINIKSFRNI